MVRLLLKILFDLKQSSLATVFRNFLSSLPTFIIAEDLFFFHLLVLVSNVCSYYQNFKKGQPGKMLINFKPR